MLASNTETTTRKMGSGTCILLVLLCLAHGVAFACGLPVRSIFKLTRCPSCADAFCVRRGVHRVLRSTPSGCRHPRSGLIGKDTPGHCSGNPRALQEFASCSSRLA